MALALGRVSSTPDENALPAPIDIGIHITGHCVDDDFNPLPVDETFTATTSAIVYTLNGDTGKSGFGLLGGVSGSILYDLLKQLQKSAPDALQEALTGFLILRLLGPDSDDKSNEEE